MENTIIHHHLKYVAVINMEDISHECHVIFDSFWMNNKKYRNKERKKFCNRLAEEMGINIIECNFGMMDEEKLSKAYNILIGWQKQREFKPVRRMKQKCHKVFDAYWRSKLKCNDIKHIRKVRRSAYHRLQQEMRKGSVRECHFHYMDDIEDLKRAYTIICGWQ